HQRHDGRLGPHPSAGRHERLCHQKRGAGREILHHLLWRAAVHRDGPGAAGDPDRVSDSRDVSAVAAAVNEEAMGKGHKDKVAVITGAANGIGQAFAMRLAEDGVHIVVADIAPGDETVKLVEAAGRQALACKCDVSSPDSVAALKTEVERRFGGCDILVNCAGIFPVQPFEEMDFADWRRLMAINLDSLFLVSSAFVPAMK